MTWITQRNLIQEPRSIARIARELFSNAPISIAVDGPDQSHTSARLLCGGVLFLPEREVTRPEERVRPASLMKTYTAPKLLVVGCTVDKLSFHFDFVFVPLRPTGVVGTATREELIIPSGPHTVHITREKSTRQAGNRRQIGTKPVQRLEFGVAHVGGKMARPVETKRYDKVHGATEIAHTAESMFNGMPVAIILEVRGQEPEVLVTYFHSIELAWSHDIPTHGQRANIDWDQFASGLCVQGLTLHEQDIQLTTVDMPLEMPERTKAIIKDEHLFITNGDWSLSIIALQQLEMG